MNLRKWMHDGDPVAAEGSLDVVDAQRMRERLVAAASAAHAQPAIGRIAWRAAAVMAAGVALAIVTAQFTRPERGPSGPADAAQMAIESLGTPRQLHFSTPRGTRVIWLFDPAFEERR